MKQNTAKMLTDTTAIETSPVGAVARFRRDDDGGMIIFSLFMFVLVLWFGGMAVDLMRFETTRAQLQGTLDRATLAAADLDQPLSATVVCEDYFAKAGMSTYLDSCVQDRGLNYNMVTATASAEMPLFFYDLPRVLTRPFSTEYTPLISSLTVSGSSTAEERVTDVEVSLVLDVSGSMDNNNRIQNLRPAAREFVSTVLGNNTGSEQGLITISMVPYSAVVNPGPQIIPLLNINRTHSYSTCPRFDDSEFNTTTLNLDATYDHISHFDPNWNSGASDQNPIAYPWCPSGDNNAIITASTDISTLHAAITALEPYGNTAIDMGVKWGVGLLDPSTKAIVTGLAGVTGTGVPALAAGRPESHTQPDVVKILVLMTDGQNTQQYDLIEPYKSDLSFVWFDLDSDVEELWRAVDDGRWAVQWTGQRTPSDYSDDRFYWNDPGNSDRSRNYPMGFANQADYIAKRQNNEGIVLGVGQGPTYANSARLASWQEIFANYTYNIINNTLLRKAYDRGYIPWNSTDSRDPDYIDSDNSIDYSVVNSSQADERLASLCAAARTQGIIIYTVAFEAPDRGQTALSDCASSSSHYFDVVGTDISKAFSAIASDIRALKLTK